MGNAIALCALWAATMIAADSAAPATAPIAWKTDYSEAFDAAKCQGKMLLVFFKGNDAASEHFEKTILGNVEIANRLGDFICLKMTLDAKTSIGGRDVTLIEQGGFRGQEGKPGVAMVDLVHRDAPYFGWVVTSLPFGARHCYSCRQMAQVFNLPAGTRAERDAILRGQEAGQAKTKLPKTGQPKGRPAPGPVFIDWQTDYAKATDKAEREGKYLFIYFKDEADRLCREFDDRVWFNRAVSDKLEECVCVELPLGAEITVEGKPQKLLEQQAFREMLGRPGIAIVDYVAKSKHRGEVVSTFPLTERLRYTPEQVLAMLELPVGTLTQRTLIYAVRIHPERPASTQGEALPRLLEEAESHSQYQANIRVQGHHRWEMRFHRVNAALPRGLTACEVCAESWPGERLVEAAIECVRCWRLSSGHWSAVRKSQACFGYDMKRGGNGVWYATGVFGGSL